MIKYASVVSDTNIQAITGLFFDSFATSKYKKGETIISAEDKLSGVYYLKRGFVRMNLFYEDGSELTLNILKPGSVFPMMWAVGEIENSYFFQAITDVVLHKIPKDKLLEHLNDHPEAMMYYLKKILSGMDGLIKTMPHFLYGNSRERVLAVIDVLSKRFGKKEKTGILVNIRLTHQEIANLAGLTRETTSLILKSLEREKIFSYRRRLFFLKSGRNGNFT